MASWHEKNLQSVDAIRVALKGVKQTADLLHVGLDATKVALAAEAAILPAAVNVADALTKIAVDQILGAIADVFSFGAYMIPIYPISVDYSRAILAEKVAKAQDVRDVRQARYADAIRQGDRAKAEQEKRALAEAERAYEALRRRSYFTVPNQLATVFDYSSFVETFKDSVTDTWDESRPQFSRASVCAGIAVCAGADAISDFAFIVQALGQWLNNADMLNEAASLAALTAIAGGTRLIGSSASSPPDWFRLTLAQALGLDGVIRQLRASAGSFGLSNLGAFGSIAAAFAWVDRAQRALAYAVDGAAKMLAVLDAIAALNAQASVCFIGPSDGEVTIEGGALVPKYVRGIDGFAEALQNAQNPPSAKWLAGVVILSGFPMGIDAAYLDSELLQQPSVKEAATAAQRMVDAFRGVLG